MIYYHNTLNPSDHANSLTERVRALECRAARLGHLADYSASYSILAGCSKRQSIHNIVHQYLLDDWQQYFPSQPKKLRSIQISSTPGKKYNKGRIKQFIFADREKEPSLLVIYCRSKKYNFSLLAELNVLKEFKSMSPEKIKIPDFVRLKTIDNLTFMIRDVWPGESLSAGLAKFRYSREFNSESLQTKVKKDFDSAANCLEELHQLTQKNFNTNGSYLEELNSNLNQVYGPVFNKHFDAVAQSVSLLHEDKTICLIHGDFTPWNLLTLSSETSVPQMAVIDWELSTNSNFRILDYGRFCYYYLTEMESLNLLAKTREEILREIFVKSEHWMTSIVQSFIEKSVGQQNLSMKQVKNLMQLMLLNDAYLQANYSQKPVGQLGDYYLNILNVLSL
jgi:hypothetical protein